MLLKEIIDIIEKFAPTNLAESWDNVGLQIGSRKQNIKKVLLTLDVTPAVTEQAMLEQYDLIIAHHPLIFSPLKNINEDTVINRIITGLIRADIALYVAHTNLDIVQGGVNDCLAEMLSLKNCQVLSPTSYEEFYKLSVFVPEEYADKLKAALAFAGAGQQDSYSDCFFSSKGTGSFRPLEKAQPFLGSIGELSLVDEIKLETIVSKKIFPQVLAAMKQAHPYEEVAYDLYPLTNNKKAQGLGRIGELATKITFDELVTVIKEKFSLTNVVTTFAKKEVQRIALCGGAGASFIPEALQQQADVLITGDIKYHEAQQAFYNGMNLIDVTHQASERIILSTLQNLLAKEEIIVEIATEQEILKIV